MKLKLVSIVAIGVMSISFSGCGNQPQPQNKKVVKEEKKNLNTLSESEQILAVQKNPKDIKYITNPSKEVQIEAAKQMPFIVAKYVKNIVPEAQVMAVKDLASAIKYINSPIEEAQLIAIDTNIELLKYIKNPTEKVQLKAIKRNTMYCTDINNLTGEAAKICNEIKILSKPHNLLKQEQIGGTGNPLGVKFSNNDIDIKINAHSGKINIQNNSENSSIRVKSVSFYYGDTVYTKSFNATLPPMTHAYYDFLNGHEYNELPVYLENMTDTLESRIFVEYELNGSSKKLSQNKTLKLKYL